MGQSEALMDANAELAEIDLTDPELQLPDEQLGIGHKTWAYHSEEEDFLAPERNSSSVE